MQNAFMGDSRLNMEGQAERLKQARELAGYDNASDAARAMGVKVPTYIGHENSARGLQRAAARYAKFFRVSLDWLLTGRGEPRGTPRILELYESLPADLKDEAERYLEFLAGKNGHEGPTGLSTRQAS